jgi:predicted transglutaminase-like cysteine proteinase
MRLNRFHWKLAVPFVLSLGLCLAWFTPAPCANGLEALFGSQQVPQKDMSILPQWLSALERHITEDLPEGACTDSLFNRCHLQRWYHFLESTKELPPEEQIRAVNRYANKKSYILDITNYGREDYWAIAREFFYNGGDCEDYAITKFFSLRWLGFANEDIRIVIMQDTNLRIPHAVLAVGLPDDVLILDNQSHEVLSHRRIAHYVPLYSVNNRQWWLHLPPVATKSVITPAGKT